MKLKQATCVSCGSLFLRRPCELARVKYPCCSQACWKTYKSFPVTWKEVGGCWICTSHRPDGRGYPMLRINQKPYKLHRVMYEKFVGVIPEGLLLRHACDQPLCINPAHLLPGTPADNSRDMAIRNRNTKSRKLDAEQVLQIRASNLSNRELASIYGVNHTNISCIKTGKTWKHLD